MKFSLRLKFAKVSQKTVAFCRCTWQDCELHRLQGGLRAPSDSAAGSFVMNFFNSIIIYYWIYAYFASAGSCSEVFVGRTFLEALPGQALAANGFSSLLIA